MNSLPQNHPSNRTPISVARSGQVILGKLSSQLVNGVLEKDPSLQHGDLSCLGNLMYPKGERADLESFDAALGDVAERYVKSHQINEEELKFLNRNVKPENEITLDNIHLGHTIKVVVSRLEAFQKEIEEKGLDAKAAKQGFVKIINGEAENLKVCTGSNFNKWEVSHFTGISKSDLGQLVVGFLRGVVIDGGDKREEVLKQVAGKEEIWLERFKDKKGYKNFARMFCEGKMKKAFDIMTAVCKKLNKSFKSLNWGNAFLGTVKEYEELIKLFKEESGINTYQGISGYKNFANKYCQGSMQKAFQLASAVLQDIDNGDKKHDINSLNWGNAFLGTVKEYDELVDLFTNKGGIEKYQGISGYKKFANEYCQGSMKKAFELASAVLQDIDNGDKKHDITSLNWGNKFDSTVKEYEELIKLFKEEGGINTYQGISGYKNFANKYCQGSMFKAFTLASAVLGEIDNGDKKHDINSLNWGNQFNGTVKEYEELIKLFKEEGGINTYQGISGYKNFANEYCKGSMEKAFKLASAVLQDIDNGDKKHDINSLNWGNQFSGTAKEYDELIKLFKEEGGINTYQGISGYKNFANKYCQGSMLKAFQLASAVLQDIDNGDKKHDINSLNWGNQFAGTAKEYEELIKLFKEEGGINTYQGISGYKNFADKYCDGSMLKAFKLASAVLGEIDNGDKKHDINSLNWGNQFNGTVKEYEELIKLFKEESGINTYQGISGYKNFANKYCQGSMFKAFTLASAVLGEIDNGDKKHDINSLNWGNCFNGTVKEYEELIKLFKEEDGIKTYQGISGYKNFANEYCQGSMKKAFELASAVLQDIDNGDKKHDINSLNWGNKFDSTVKEYEELVELFTNKDGIKTYQGILGYKKFADKYCQGSMKKAFQVASAVLQDIDNGDKKHDIKVLNWGNCFLGTVKEYEAQQ